MKPKVHFTSKVIKTSLFTLCGLWLTGCGGDDDNNSGGNQAPEVVLAESNISVEFGQTVSLDASGSSDPEGEALTFSWTGEGGTISGADSSEVTIVDLAVGTYSYTVTVSDGENASTATASVEVTGPQVQTVTKLDTGTMQEPNYVYFDLDANEELLLTEEEAQANSDWDIAFRRTSVYLNQYAETPVTLYFTGNTDDFYDDEGDALVERFINATGETELAAFEAYSGEVPAEAQFHSDSTESVINGFYIYDINTHTVSANDAAYFVVDSDNAYAKFRATSMVQDGFGMASITLGVATQSGEETSFSAEQSLEVDATGCAADIYIDLATQSVVEASGDWDLSIPCSNALAGFEINIADDATALNESDAEIAGVDAELAPYWGWETNTVEILAIKQYGPASSNYGWAEYGVNGGHLMWPNFATYVIQTEQARYKFQILNYYDVDDSASGSYTIRYQKILNN